MKRFYVAAYKDAELELARILTSIGNVALVEPVIAVPRPAEAPPEVQLEEIEVKLAELRKAAEVMEYLKKLGLKANEIGDFTYAFVTVGTVPNDAVPKLKSHIGPFFANYEVRPLDNKRALVVVVGPLEYKSCVVNALQLLNFEELEIPDWVNPDPEVALKELREKMEELIKAKIASRVAGSALRIADFTVLTGWAPEFVVDDVKKELSKLGDKLVYFGVEDPLPGDEVPVKLRHKGLLEKLSLLTELRGLPSYFELDPTPIFGALYALMFGMMFGDIGGGLLLLAIGAVLMRRGNGLGKFGGLLAACGASATAFGLLYGSVFLNEELLKHFYEEVFHRTPLSPMHDYTTIMIIALVFGAIQMFAAMTLSTINQFLWGDTVNLLTSRWGIPSLVYYASGIVLAVKFTQGGMNVAALTAPDALPFVGTCVAMLILMTVSPLIKHYAHSKEISFVALIEGFGEVLEVFLSYITNSVSYVRLAAFAISHAALASAAVTLTASMGEIGAYLFMNGIAILIEGFAAGIQAMRLLYYEFSTKFYKGGGKPFEPITS